MSEIRPGQPGIHDIWRLQPFVDSLPAGEEKGAMLLIYNLVQLHKYVNEFAAAVGLLDLVDLQQRDIEAGNLDPEARARCTHMLMRWIELYSVRRRSHRREKMSPHTGALDSNRIEDGRIRLYSVRRRSHQREDESAYGRIGF